MSLLFWQPYELLTRLYEHMRLAAPARTPSTKGHKYSSCIVLSSMLEEAASVPLYGRRHVSCSFATRCWKTGRVSTLFPATGQKLEPLTLRLAMTPAS